MLSFCEVTTDIVDKTNTYFCFVSFDRFVLTTF